MFAFDDNGDGVTALDTCAVFEFELLKFLFAKRGVVSNEVSDEGGGGGGKGESELCNVECC